MPTYAYTDQVLDQTTANLAGESSITIRRTIVRLDGAVINLVNETEAIVTEGHLPIQDEDYGVSGTGYTWAQYAKARGYTLSLLDSGRAVRADIRFSTRYVVNPNSTTSALYMLPAHTSYITTARTMQIYRTSWSVNPPTTASNSSSTDIGGTSLTGADGSQSIQVGQVRVRTVVMQDASVTAMTVAASTLSSYGGTITNTAFGGFPAYSLICEGVSLEKDPGTEFYSVTFEFLFDRFYHFNQVCAVDADGRPRMTTTGALSDVRWQRLPRTATDFNNIFGGDLELKAMALGGWWL
jgi:hypothetical protein